MDTHPYTLHPKHQEMLQTHRAMWNGLLRVALFSVIGIVTLLSLMATFLTHHS